jgi:Tfp pilus assembly pilus retraction ATPase PilT
VVEIFKATARTAHAIECDDPSGETLLNIVKNGTADGMQDFDSEIAKLVGAGVVDFETALNHATESEELRRMMQD